MATKPAALLALLTTLCSTAHAQELGGLAVFTDPEGRVHADSAHFRAAFTRSGTTVGVPSPTGSEIAPELRLQFIGAIRGNRTLATDPHAPPEQVGDHVKFQRGELTEHFRVERQGVEQSFRIAAAPSGAGDLHIKLWVDGNVTASAFPPAHRAITFCHGDVRAIRYGEAHVLDRAGQHCKIATAYDGNGHLDLIVPAAFLDKATYPVTVDPAVGPVANPGGAIYDDSNPDVAYDAHYYDEYSVVWQRRFSASSIVLRYQRFDRNGIATTGVKAITNSGIATNPACVMNDRGMLLVAYETNNRIEATKLHWTGIWPSQHFVISTPASGEKDGRPSVSGNHWYSDFTVAWERTPAGGTNAQEILVRHWYESPGQVHAGGPEQVLVSVPPVSGHLRGVRLPQNAGRLNTWSGHLLYRAVWDRFYNSPAPGDYDVHTCSFRFIDDWVASTSVLQIDQSPSTVATGIGTDELTPAIGARGYGGGDMNYCIAWEDSSDVRARMYDHNGPTGGAFDVRATSDYQGMPAVSAGNCEFTIAYGEIPANAGFAVDVRAARLLADGTVTVNDRPIDAGSGVFQHNIRACSSEWFSLSVNSTFVVWAGQTGPAGSGLNDVRARVFEPVDALRSFYGSACPGSLGELPQIGINKKPVPGEVVLIHLDNAPPGSVALLVCSDSLISAPLPGAPGCSAYVGGPFLATWLTATSSAGNVSMQVAIPCSVPPPMTLAFQWAILTPGHNALGLITSNDMDVTWVQ